VRDKKLTNLPPGTGAVVAFGLSVLQNVCVIYLYSTRGQQSTQ